MNKLKKIFGFMVVTVIAISLAYAPVAFADAGKGKSLFESKAKKCKTCHKATGDPNKFKPVGPGLKGVGKKLGKEYLQKWLSPNNAELWGSAIDEKGKIISEPEYKNLKDLMSRYKAAKKGKKMKKSQMVKNFAPGKKGKAPKIVLTDQEKNDIVDYLMTL